MATTNPAYQSDEFDDVQQDDVKTTGSSGPDDFNDASDPDQEVDRGCAKVQSDNRSSNSSEDIAETPKDVTTATADATSNNTNSTSETPKEPTECPDPVDNLDQGTGVKIDPQEKVTCKNVEAEDASGSPSSPSQEVAAMGPPTSVSPMPSPPAGGDQNKKSVVAVPAANGDPVVVPRRDLVALRREIGLFSAVTIILGNIIGSGIFITPTNVYINAGSIGMSMVVWIASGVFSTIGALCFAELGTTINSSGAEYTYVKEAFGDIFAFLILWVNLIIIIPTGHMIVALTFAYYLVEPFYPDPECPPPDLFVRLMAVLVQALLTFVNCWSVPWATKVQDVFTIAKVLALVVIIASGLIWICMGHTENFENAFEGSADGESIALAFYGGLFAYAAWNYLNYLTEEIKNPQKNLPWAIAIAVPLVTIIYVLANVAYFAVLTPEELLASNAVAVTYGEKLFGPMAWIMPVSVAMSTFGGVNGGCLSLSRLFFVGAREGQLPEVMAMIQVKRKTPLPSLLFTCVLTILYVFVKRIETLLNYFSFMTWLAIGAAVAGQIYLRYKKPDLPRPIKFPIILPIIFVAACLFLVIMGTIAAPMDTLIGCLITLTGFPVYFIGIYWQNKPEWLLRINQKFTIFNQKTFLIVSQEKED